MIAIKGSRRTQQTQAEDRPLSSQTRESPSCRSCNACLHAFPAPTSLLDWEAPRSRRAELPYLPYSCTLAGTPRSSFSLLTLSTHVLHSDAIRASSPYLHFTTTLWQLSSPTKPPISALALPRRVNYLRPRLARAFKFVQSILSLCCTVTLSKMSLRQRLPWTKAPLIINAPVSVQILSSLTSQATDRLRR